MKRARIVMLGAASLGLLLAQACSGDDSTQSDAGKDGSVDATTDVVNQKDASGNDASDSGTSDASDGGCPGSWTVAPAVDTSIAVPADGGSVLLHAAATGTQDYTCEAVVNSVDGGTTYKWTFVGPEADLHDCNAAVIAHHFANDAGAPEWMATDGSYVIGSKVSAFDGGASSIPWLLLQSVGNGGTGSLTNAGYIQRLDTDGGLTPSTTCDSNNVGTTSKTPYAADYWFFGGP